MGTRFLGEGKAEGVAASLTSEGRAALEAAFPKGAGPEFEGKAEFLKEIREPGSKKRLAKLDESNERARGKSCEGRSNSDTQPLSRHKRKNGSAPNGTSRQAGTDVSSSSDSSSP